MFPHIHFQPVCEFLVIGLMSQSRVVDASGKPVPDSPMQFSSSNFGSSNGSGSDLECSPFETVHFETQIAKIPSLTNWMSRIHSHITKTLGDFSTRLTEIEQNFNALATRMC